MASLLHRISKYRFRNFPSANRYCGFLRSSVPNRPGPNPLRPPFQVRTVVSALDTVGGFADMASGSQRKYFMLGGKGGVGKTSCAASLAVKFANHGHPIIVVPTDPAHSLSDSFDQDLSGGTLVPVQGVDSPLYSLEGHTLRLLSLPDFLGASLRKTMKLKKKIASATPGLKSAFRKGEPEQDSVMALSESSRLCASLRKNKVPIERLIVNQLLPPSLSDCKFCEMRRKDQMRALDMIQRDLELGKLKLIQSQLFDVEIRGVPALKFIGDMVWK